MIGYINKLALIVYIVTLCGCGKSSTYENDQSQLKQLASVEDIPESAHQMIVNGKNFQKVRPLSSLDEACFGMTAKDVLTRIRSEYNTILKLESADQTPLTIKIQYKNGQILCFPPRKAPPGSRLPDQDAYLEIEVEMKFFSTDRKFKEKYRTNISGRSNTALSFSHRIKSEQIQGSYISKIVGYEEMEVGIHGMFEDDRCWGSIIVYRQRSGMAPVTTIVGNWSNRN